MSVRRVSDGRVVDVLAGERGPALRRIAFSPDGSTLLALGTDGIVRIWDREEERVVRRLGSRNSPIADAAFSPGGSDIATIRGRRVVITNLESGDAVVTARVSPASLASVAYSSDSRNILVAGRDGQATVLDAGELRSFATFIGSGESLTSASFSPNGMRVAISGDGAAQVFRCDLCAPPPRLLTIAQSKATRDLSPSERRRYLHESR